MKLCDDPTCTCRTMLPHHINPDNKGCNEGDCIRSPGHAGPHSSTLTDSQMQGLPRSEELIHLMLQRALVGAVMQWLEPGVQLPLSGPEMTRMKDAGHKLRAFRSEWQKKGVTFP